jgi:UDP-N-acetylglucosamine--N-acetylmuramyl-(pentapeptide) pyrophosphoryl-undecaprenol N-acetylglucosamine transferase
MSTANPFSTRFAVACGGTGGHFFPGLAVARQLRERGGEVSLLISPKDVDQKSVRAASGLDIITLPGVGLQRGGAWSFWRGFGKSYLQAVRHFRLRPPVAVLGMGGFTSAPPLLAARSFGARIFLHESNTIPGRANRYLSWLVDRAFTGFPVAADRLHTRKVTVTGTPVRTEFAVREPAACRVELGLDPEQPVVLVMGGSQGASAINNLALQVLPLLVGQLPGVQWLHLTGSVDFEKMKAGYAGVQARVRVLDFLDRMDLALGAATVSLSRSGASSLAEIAAMEVPSILIPYPAAMDNHQYFNAWAFKDTGAARAVEQKDARPEALANWIAELAGPGAARESMQRALRAWQRPAAAEEIAGLMLKQSQLENLRIEHRLLQYQ